MASPSTASADTGVKREFYESLGIPEYWRFDHTGNDYGAKLAGDRLVDDRYEAIFIESAGEDIEQGYSDALNLYLRWEDGQLVFIDPATNAPILTYEDQAAKAESEKARADKQPESEEKARQPSKKRGDPASAGRAKSQATGRGNSPTARRINSSSEAPP